MGLESETSRLMPQRCIYWVHKFCVIPDLLEPGLQKSVVYIEKKPQNPRRAPWEFSGNNGEMLFTGAQTPANTS